MWRNDYESFGTNTVHDGATDGADIDSRHAVWRALDPEALREPEGEIVDGVAGPRRGSDNRARRRPGVAAGRPGRRRLPPPASWPAPQRSP